MWDPPPTAGVLNSLSYQLTVTNMITSQVIVSTTTTDTSYTLPQLTPCQEYMANVTASSSEHQGETAFTVQRSPGGESCLKYCIIIFNDVIMIIMFSMMVLFFQGYYKIKDVSDKVVVNYNGNFSSAVVFITVQLQVRTLIFVVVIIICISCYMYSTLSLVGRSTTCLSWSKSEIPNVMHSCGHI